MRDELQIEVGYSTLVRWLHEQGFRLKVPQPWPDRQDEAQRQQYLEARGEKTPVTHNGDHMRSNVTGMICPHTGAAFMLEFSHNDRVIFQVFLDEANKLVATERRRNILVCDNASWHKCKSLEWGKFEPMFLPPYSPDFNPIERLWLPIKAEWFSDFVAKNRNMLTERLDAALNWAMARPRPNQQTCSIRKII